MNRVAVITALMAAAVAGIPAFASDVAQITRMDVTTVKSEPFVQQNIIAAPETVSTTTVTTAKTNINLVPNCQPQVYVINPTQALLATPGIMIELVRPDDLITRQAELNARILVEQNAGTITGAQANELLTRLNNVASTECQNKLNGNLTWKQVGDTYKSYDRISHDLDNYSTDRGHRLAGSFIVL
jgi:hypothetical protein